MCLLQTVLERPHYGFADANGGFTRPTHAQIWREFFSRLNLFRDRRNWLVSLSWFAAVCFVPFFVTFFLKYFSWKLFFAGFVYSMVLMGTHGTIYLHRYGTHRAFKFKNRFWLFLARNLVIKVIPEEIYIVSHHVHHKYSEGPWDPYNVNGGWLYCFLADANHQTISRTLSESDYLRVARMVEHTGVKPNSFQQYLRWGTVAHPARTVFHFAANWITHFLLFYWIGGIPLAIAIFGMAGVWAFGVRTYNFDGHGRGLDKRKDGIDFNRKDQSINQVWPGYVAGEWHNNHHLYPSSARSGFLPYQFDGAWEIIRLWHKVGVVSSYRDDKAAFLKNNFTPYHRSPEPQTLTHP
ncbi:MAG: fatty acid desaturase [Bdellovibrionales bacterium]|nr:fatty acid desaturase [Bdellovibrionales bacterium]